jgi:electron transfer flavoprotein alpha subunit
MSVIVFAEHNENIFKKSSFEAISYGKDLADKLNTNCVAVAIGCSDTNALSNLGKYGASKVLNATGNTLKVFEAAAFAKAFCEVAQSQSGNVVIISNTYNGKSLAPRVAARMNASIVSGIVAMADTTSGFSVKKSCFSNKAFTYVQMKEANKVLALVPNSYPAKESGSSVTPENVSVAVSDADIKTISKSISTVKGKVPLTEAEVVVSGGRGMKGPENWGMIEELAEWLGAATACSKPVADMDWRPHSEHVGQTGITIKPNLYMAIGISGAIQHLAGVGSSKVICVINKDPEAPFFKAADYGIVGDAFEVLPQLIERAKQLKA